MTKEFQIRGCKDVIYFGEKRLDRSVICKLEFNPRKKKQILKTEVFELNNKLVALERDAEEND